jgi:hypothetical protein
VAEHSWPFYGFQNSSNSKTIGILTRKSSLCRKSWELRLWNQERVGETVKQRKWCLPHQKLASNHKLVREHSKWAVNQQDMCLGEDSLVLENQVSVSRMFASLDLIWPKQNSTFDPATDRLACTFWHHPTFIQSFSPNIDTMPMSLDKIME